jgi:3-mercaptopyruvate sulfurtransferase SseA
MVRTAKRGTEAKSIRRQSGRIPGARNIHQPTLYDLISRYRPINSVMWKMVEF